MRLIILLLAAFSLQGCFFPKSGTGGFAEHRMGKMIPVEAGKPLGPEHGLRFDMELTRRHLDMLVMEGAELCFPATIVQAKQRANRITRELEGGLSHDAANDLIVQRQMLARLERQLDYVKSRGACKLPVASNQDAPGDIGKRIDSLLNSDNQFAHNSSKLNPKYVGRLAEAATLLRDMPGYRLRIVGHADSFGTEQHNAKLSMARAEQVARYLQILGIEKKRIEVDAVGSNHPYFAGKEPQNRLVNRRVSIELVETTNITNIAQESRRS